MYLTTLLLYPAGFLATLTASAAYIWYRKPILLARFGLYLALRKSGLEVKYVKGKQYTFCYGERGQPSPNKSSLLLIHGFSASKDMFVPVVKRLPSDLHIIVIDLPGHGGTTVPSVSDDLSLDSQILHVHEFVELVSLSSRPFHLAGTSMGGIISAVYAMKYTKFVEKLSLICPAFETPISTKFMEDANRGECSLIPNNVDEMRSMLDSCFYNKNIVPKQKQILQGTLDIRTPRNGFFRRLFDALLLEKDESRQKLEEEAKKLTSPTQLVWGKQDEIIHPSGADQLQELLPNVQRVDLLDECGHSVSFDRPGLLVKVLLEFRGDSPATADDGEEKKTR